MPWYIVVHPESKDLDWMDCGGINLLGKDRGSADYPLDLEITYQSLRNSSEWTIDRRKGKCTVQ